MSNGLFAKRNRWRKIQSGILSVVFAEFCVLDRKISCALSERYLSHEDERSSFFVDYILRIRGCGVDMASMDRHGQVRLKVIVWMNIVQRPTQHG